jgi:DNA-binding PadR family transcriptional regulator
MSKEWFGFHGARPLAFAFAQGRRGGRFFESGEIRLAILSLLAGGPKHGYQLMKEIGERSGGMYKASAGSIYPTLQQLEDELLVTSRTEGGRKVYTLTDAGRKEVAGAPDAVHRIWERAGEFEEWGHFMNPESSLILHALSGVIKESLQASRRVGPEPVRTILERTRRTLEGL